MRKFTLLVIATLFATLCSAQMLIDSESRIGVGMNPESDSKFSILNHNWNYGLRTETDPDGNGTFYGLHNTLMGGSNSTNFGRYSLTYGYGSGNNYGLYNRAFHYGSGLNYGLFNYSRHYGTGEHIALYNVMWYNGSGQKTGIYTFLGDDEPENSGSSSSMFGNRIKIRTRHFPNVYGNYIDLVNSSGNSNASRNLFGTYIKIDGSNAAYSSYGVYSYVEDVPGANNYAGYFAGDVVTNQPTIVTSDSTVKDDIKDVKGAREILKKLKPKSYRYKKDNRFATDSERTSYGFLAQELEQILPEMVVDVHHPEITDYADPELPDEVLNDDSLNSGNRRENKTPNPGHHSDDRREQTGTRVRHKAETLKGIRYLELIPILTQALQEQDAELTNLKKLTTANGKTISPDTTFGLELRKLQQENEILRGEITAIASRTDSIKLYYQNKVTALEEANQEYHSYLSVVQTDLEDLKDRIQALEECTDCTNGIGLHQATLAGKHVSVYPNPASGKVTVNNTITDNYLVRVLTADGREHARLQAADWIISIDVSAWPTGTYVFETYDNGILLHQESIIVQR